MNELKSNKSIIRSSIASSGNSSNVSTFVKKEEKTYVNSYSMTKKRREKWIDNHLGGDDEAILHPPVRKFKASEAVADPDRREKARILLICVCVALVMLLLIPAIKIASSYLVIEEIRVEGTSLYSDVDLLESVGLNFGDSLPLMSVSSAEASVLANLPYVSNCEIGFELPNVVIFRVVEEAPMLYTEIVGEYYILTTSLRVLERTLEETELDGLLYVELPRVSQAVVGEEIVLEGTSNAYITEFFSLINSSELKDRLGVVYLDKKFDIVASVDGKFRVLFGSLDSMEQKIDSVAKMIEENDDKCLSTGIIDVRVSNICGIILDSDIDPNSRE